VLDPFCGQGTVLALANAFGFDAIGVDLSKKRCKIARNLVIALPETSTAPAPP
jgi:tRNA G10  N-methylase Trm11